MKGYEYTLYIYYLLQKQATHSMHSAAWLQTRYTSFLEKCLDQPMEDNDPDTHIYSNTTNFLASSCVADFLHGCNFVPTFTIKKGYMQQASTGKENR